jgi:hypothetical protein
VRRWHFIVLACVAALGIVYTIMHRPQLGLAGNNPTGSDDIRNSSEPPTPAAHPAGIIWVKVDRPADGFRVEMPAGIGQIQVPAYSANGGEDAVNMILSNPGVETQFSVSWADNPPVVRASSDAPDRMLDMARDGALARTQTTLVSESASNSQGFPGRDFSVRNAGGGVMNSRWSTWVRGSTCSVRSFLRPRRGCEPVFQLLCDHRYTRKR